MFDIGPEKLLFVLAIALAVLGPERIPHVARGLGKFRAEIRRLTSDIHPDALEALSNPRGALLRAVAEPARALAEPTRAVSEAVTQQRLALVDAVSDFRRSVVPTGPSPAHDSGPPSGYQGAPAPTPDDPAFN